MTHRNRPKHLAPSWFRKRLYRHFDSPILARDAERLVINFCKRPHHAFWPFIRYEKPKVKWRRFISSKTGKLNINRIESKPRLISYAAHADSALHAYYAEVLNNIYEAQITTDGISECVLAYRRSLGKCNVDFAITAFLQVNGDNLNVALAMDVQDFFGSINHLELKRCWASLYASTSLPLPEYRIFQSITQYAYVDRSQLLQQLGLSKKAAGLRKKKTKATQRCSRVSNAALCTCTDFHLKVREKGLIRKNRSGRGIPQGSPISALLSNVYMRKFDIAMFSLAQKHSCIYRRYSDDLLFICNSSAAPRIESECKDALRELNLSVNDKKTNRVLFVKDEHNRINSFKAFLNPKTQVLDSAGPAGFSYLGLVFDGQSIHLRSSSVSRYYAKLKRSVRIGGKTALRQGQYKIFRKNLYLKTLRPSSKHRSFLTYAMRAHSIACKAGALSSKINCQSSRNLKLLNKWLVAEEKKNQFVIVWKLKIRCGGSAATRTSTIDKS